MAENWICAALQPGMHLLEASAGTGKTYTIAALVLRLVAEQNIPLDEILVVTFTRAATAELRDRIRARLTQALTAFEQDSPDEKDPVHQQIYQQMQSSPANRTRVLLNLHLAIQQFELLDLYHSQPAAECSGRLLLKRNPFEPEMVSLLINCHRLCRGCFNKSTTTCPKPKRISLGGLKSVTPVVRAGQGHHRRSKRALLPTAETALPDFSPGDGAHFSRAIGTRSQHRFTFSTAKRRKMPKGRTTTHVKKRFAALHSEFP